MNQTFVDPKFVCKKGVQLNMVTADGELEFARTYNLSARRSAQTDTLSEVHGNKDEVILSEVISESEELSFAIRELLSPVYQTHFASDGRAPTITTHKTLRRQAMMTLLNEDEERRIQIPYGLVQAHDATNFPAPTALNASAGAGAGTFSATTWYCFVIPAYVDLDDKHGITAALFTLANYGSYKRGVEFTLGTPSASDNVVLGAPDDILLSFTNPVGGPRPTAFLVVTATADDVNHASAKVSAIVPYGTTSVTMGAEGTVAFTADPALADMQVVEIVGVAAEARAFASVINGTDVTIDAVDGTIQRKEGGVITSGQRGVPIRYNFWYFAEGTVEHTEGGSNVTDKYVHLRARNLAADGTDPDTRTPRGFQIDFPKVNLAGAPREIFSGNEDGFHAPLNVGPLQVSLCDAGYLHKATTFGNYKGLIDFFSDDIADAA